MSTDPMLNAFEGQVSDSGEGRWTIHAAIDEGVPAPVLSAALYQRFSSRGHAGIADKVLSAMRSQFGGHAEKVAGDVVDGRIKTVDVLPTEVRPSEVAQ
jgi:6-phosphogluconate dehydrogenase